MDTNPLASDISGGHRRLGEGRSAIAPLLELTRCPLANTPQVARFATFLWIGQFFILACGAVARWVLVGDMARLDAPFWFGLALLSSYAAMREDPRARRGFAWLFALVFGGVAGLAFERLGPLAPAVVGAGLASLANLVAAVLPIGRRTRERRLSGTADTKPSSVWALWIGQGLFWLALGAVMAAAPAWLSAALGGGPDGPWQLRLGGPVVAGLGLSSFMAARSDQDWIWKTFALLFAGVHLTFAFTVLVEAELRLGAPLGLLLLLGSVGLAGANGRARSQAPNWLGEDVGAGPDGWTVMDLFTGPMLAVQSVMKKRRSTHLYGVGANGRFQVVDHPRFPPNVFFTPGREFPLQARFATVTFPDDASFDVRGAAIRLAKGGEPSPFDVLMNTGSYAAFSNVVQFGALVVSKFFPQWVSKTLTKSSHVVREGALAGLRHGPDSFADLHYYSETVRFWIDEHDQRWLVRWRLLADPDVPESGLPDEADEDHPWVRERRAGDTRSRDYLRRELKARLEGPREIALRLQAQFHLPSRGDGLQWYDAAVDWNPRAHPWVDVGVVVLEDAMSDADAERLAFNASNHPPTLGVPAAEGPFDPRSLADSERRIIRRLQRLRAWMYGSFGLPGFGGDR
jgi:hypothetical protein